MNRFLMVCAASLGLCALSSAQSSLPPEIPRGLTEPAPLIDAEAQQFVEAMMARYAALKSYSDIIELRVENEAGAPVKGGDWLDDMKFQAFLDWERPARIRFQGTDSKGKFLALGTDQTTFIASERYPKYYVARPRTYAAAGTTADGTPYKVTLPIQFDEPLMGSPIPFASSLGFMLGDKEFWPRTLKDVRALGFDSDAETAGEACRVVRIQIADDSGINSVMRLFVAKSDGLLRRVENRFDLMPADTFTVETHSNIEVNPFIPNAQWNFTPPTAATAVAGAMAMQEQTMDFSPDIQIGDALPTFSADALDGTPLEFNAQSGKATLVHFFTMNSGVYDVQILNNLARAAGPDNLQIVGVNGDNLRPRVEAFAARYGLKFPIYFDESGRANDLSEKFDIRNWASTFVFGADGKLQFIGGRPGSVETIAAIRKLLPEVPAEAFVLQSSETLDAE